jgi:hemerythrin
MLTGIQKIDMQHKELIDRLNRLISLKADSDEEVRRMLDFLDGYIVRHFGDEETLQIQSNYPKFERHKSQHQLLADEYQHLRQEFDRVGFSAEFSLKLQNAVVSGIVNHMKLLDVEFGKYYCIRRISLKESNAAHAIKSPPSAV